MPAKKLTPQAQKFIKEMKGFINYRAQPAPKKKYAPTTILVKKSTPKNYA